MEVVRHLACTVRPMEAPSPGAAPLNLTTSKMTRIHMLTRSAVAVFGLAAIVALSGCQTTRGPSKAQSEEEMRAALAAKTDVGVQAFQDICLATAPDFASAEKLAAKYGAKDWIELGEGKSAMTADDSLSVQIKPGKECAITTPSRPGRQAVWQFADAVTKATGLHTATGEGGAYAAIAVGAYRGQGYVFGLDRNGGEAYVMLGK